MTYARAAHQRHSIRLKGYDYARAGAYFITICTHQRQYFFGDVVRAGLAPAQMQLNELGQIALEQWHYLSERFKSIETDAFVVMPNHIHGIIVIHDPQPEEAGFTPTPIMAIPTQISQNAQSGGGASPPPTGIPIWVTVGNIVGAYKSLVANECLKIFKTQNETMGKLWQRNYYEHIIRDEKSYLEIAQYIFDNPAKWASDSLFSGGTL